VIARAGHAGRLPPPRLNPHPAPKSVAVRKFLGAQDRGAYVPGNRRPLTSPGSPGRCWHGVVSRSGLASRVPPRTIALRPQVRRKKPLRRRRGGSPPPRAVRRPGLAGTPVAGELRSPRHGAAARAFPPRPAAPPPGPSHGTRSGVRKGRGQRSVRVRLVAGRNLGRQEPRQGPTRSTSRLDLWLGVAQMNGKLTDEGRVRARAALGLPGGADRRLASAVLRVHGAAVTLAAIQGRGRLLGTGEGTGRAAGGLAQETAAGTGGRASRRGKGARGGAWEGRHGADGRPSAARSCRPGAGARLRRVRDSGHFVCPG